MRSIDRRAVLAGLATTATATTTTSVTAIAAAAPNPIFAAIERCRSRWAAANASDRREDDDLPSLALDEADRQFVQTVPTTVAGLLAFIAYHRSRDNGDDIGRKWTDTLCVPKTSSALI